MNIIKKISTKTVYGEVKRSELYEAKGQRIDLYDVFGIAKGVKSGESNYGDWHALTGSFRAVNVETGEEFQAGTLFLPGVGHDLIAGLIGDAEAVEFALRVSVAADDTSQIGYAYHVTPLIEPTEGDPLSKLQAQVQESRKALEAPKGNARQSARKKAAAKKAE